MPATKPTNNTAAINTPVVITIAAQGPGLKVVLKMLTGSYSAAPTGGRITVSDGRSTLYDHDITAAGSFTVPIPTEGLEAAPNSPVTVTLAAAGASVIGKLNTAHVVA